MTDKMAGAKSGLGQVAQRWLSALVEPVPALRDPLRRRQARLLATVTLGLVCFNGFFLLLYVPIALANQGVLGIGLLGLLGSTCAAGAAYRLSVHGHLEQASTLMLSLMTVFLFALDVGGDPTYRPIIPYYYPLVVIGGLLFAPLRLLVLMPLHLLLMLALPLVLPDVALYQVLVGPLSFYVITTLVLGAVLYVYRKWYLEQHSRSQENLNRYRALVETMQDIVYSITPDGTLTFVNPAFAPLSGYALEEVTGRHFITLVHTDDAPHAVRSFQQVLDGEPAQAVELRMRLKNGGWLCAETLFFAERRDGQVVAIYGVARDVTARDAAAAARRESERLRLELDKERELNVARTQMMNTIAHEFRTPLTMIQIAQEMLTRYRERFTPEQQAEKLAGIHRQVQHLQQLLDDTTLIVRGQYYDSLRATLVPLNIAQICASEAAQLEALTDDPRIVATCAPDCPLVLADERLLRRLVGGLLSNALKYSRRPVHLDVWHEPDEVALCVRDEGKGIPADERERVFDAFYRASNVRDAPGVGLGLTIVRVIVALHGWRLALESQVDSGTAVTVRMDTIRKVVADAGLR